MPKIRVPYIEEHGRSYRYVRWIGNRRIRRRLDTDNLAEAIRRADIITAELEGRGPKNYEHAKRIANHWGPEEGIEIAELLDHVSETERAIIVKNHTPLSDVDFDRWTRDFSINYRRRAKRVQGLLTDFLRAKNKPETFEAVDRQTALDFKAWREDVGNNPTTVTALLSALRGLWAHMGDRRANWSNPWEGIRVKARKDREPVRPFTDEEARMILVVFPEKTVVGDVCRIAILSGMRLGEILQMKIEDVADGVIHIPKAKTQAGRRRVPINGQLAPILARLAEGKAPTMTFFSPKADVSDPFGQKLRELGIADVREGSRRSRVSFHSWRHGATTTLLQNGISDFVIAHLVGHKHKDVTKGVYGATGPSIEQLRAAVALLRLP